MWQVPYYGLNGITSTLVNMFVFLIDWWHRRQKFSKIVTKMMLKKKKPSGFGNDLVFLSEVLSDHLCKGKTVVKQKCVNWGLDISKFDAVHKKIMKEAKVLLD